MERFAHHGSLLLQCIRAGVCFRVRAIKISACGYVPAGALKSAQNLYVSGALCYNMYINYIGVCEIISDGKAAAGRHKSFRDWSEVAF